MSPLTMFGGWLLNVGRSCHGRFFDAGARRQAQDCGHECPNFICEFAWIGSLFAHQDTDHVGDIAFARGVEKGGM
jgi:hypothetical protein